jgi:ketosteroid isomerase-like protein
MKPYLLAVVPFLFLTGCSSRVNMEKEKNELLEADRAWAAAASSNNIEQTLHFWTDDAVIYFPGQPAVSGKAEIRKFITRNRSNPAFSLSWTPQEAVAAESGELGYTRGIFQVSLPGPQAAIINRSGNYLCIWRKQDDGSWQCSMEISNFLPGHP